MPKSPLRKELSAPGLLKTIRRCFSRLSDGRVSREISLPDCLMSGLTGFGLKYPSLLQFDQNKNEALIQSNLRALYGINQAPSDTD